MDVNSLTKYGAPNIIFLVGTTTAGKTNLAIELAQRIPCEIISVDAAMVYKNMNVGTAKPSPQVLHTTAHHLINICQEDEIYTVAKFYQDARHHIDKILSKGNIPLLVGGSMMYYHALQTGIANLPASDAKIRHSLNLEAQEKGWQHLHKRLAKIDPIAAQRIHPNDHQRLQRALEVYMLSGKSLSSLLNNHTTLPYNILKLCLQHDKEEINRRIAKRWHTMLEQGLIQEVTSLYNQSHIHADLPAMKCINYRQVWQYLTEQINLEQMQTAAINATKQLAKKQRTWLNSWDNINYLHSNAFTNPLDKAIKIFKSAGITN